MEIFQARQNVECQNELEDIKNNILEERIEIAERQLDRLILQGYFPAIRFFLENRGRAHGYGQHAATQNTIDQTDMVLEAIRQERIKTVS